MIMPLFKVRRLSLADSNDEYLLRSINIFSSDKGVVDSILPKENRHRDPKAKIEANPDANYLKLYKQHAIWLNKVIKELKEGKKVAFGAFRNYTPPFSLFPDDVVPEELLIGSVIIKKGHSGQIELKNLLTNHNNILKFFGERTNSEKDQLEETKIVILQKLIERVENFCSFRNYRRVAIEIASKSYNLINFFLNNQYSIIHTRRSKYKESDYFYIFSKNLSNFQGNDPYDYAIFVKNLLSYYYPFVELKQTGYNGKDVESNLETIYLTVKPNIDVDSETSLNYVQKDSLNTSIKDSIKLLFNESLQVYIECKIDFDLTQENGDKNQFLLIDKEFFNKYDSSAHLKLLFTDKKIVANKENFNIQQFDYIKSIKVLEWSEFENQENIKKLYLNKLIKKSDIEGFLLVVEEKMKRRIVNLSDTNGPYKIHLFDGCGKYIKSGDNTDFHKSLKVFFFSHSSGEQPLDGIWGYADLMAQGGGVEGVFEISETEYKSDLGEIKSIYNEDELNYFSFYNDDKDKNVVVFIIDNIKIFPKIVPLDQRVLSKKMVDYTYKREGSSDTQWFDPFWFNSYLDHETVHNVLLYNERNVSDNMKEASEPSISKLEDKIVEKFNDEILIKVVILTAIKIEYDAVKAHLVDIQSDHRNNTSYETGIFIFNEKRIAKVFIRECGHLNSNSSRETERAIVNFEPYCMFFVGIAGSRKPNDFKIGDVIFPSKIYYYEGGKSGENGFSSRPELESLSYTFLELAKHERGNNSWKSLIKSRRKKGVKADIGIIASGEKIIEHTMSEIGKIIFQGYEDTSAIEMEGFGFASTASSKQGRKTNNILVGIVRGISDIISSEGKISSKDADTDRRPDSNKVFASNTAAAFTFWLIAKHIENEKLPTS